MQGLLGGNDDASVDCGYDSVGGYSCQLMVYPSPVNLSYTLAASAGELDGPVIRDIEIVETVKAVPPETELTVKYPVLSIITAEAFGNVYDATGVQTDPVNVGLIDGKIVLSKPVYCLVRVKYLVRVHGYGLKISNGGQCTVYGRWDGGIRWLTIEPPPRDCESDSDATCGFGHGSGHIDDWPTHDPEALKSHKITEIDYCSQDIISEHTT